MNTSAVTRIRYSYEEFADHIRAMRTVRGWEYTSRFGHVGNAQTSRAQSERVLEYFSDSYEDPKEALEKAELFLSIHDYVGRNVGLFRRKGMVEQVEGVYLVEPNLLRAVHFAFTVSGAPQLIPIKRILNLAKAFRNIDSE